MLSIKDIKALTFGGLGFLGENEPKRVIVKGKAFLIRKAENGEVLLRSEFSKKDREKSVLH
jgi:hypothetical protein